MPGSVTPLRPVRAQVGFKLGVGEPGAPATAAAASGGLLLLEAREDGASGYSCHLLVLSGRHSDGLADCLGAGRRSLLWPLHPSRSALARTQRRSQCSSLGRLRRAVGVDSGAQHLANSDMQRLHSPAASTAWAAFPRRPCTVSAYPGSIPEHLQCHGPRLQQVAQATAQTPADPSRETPSGHWHRLLASISSSSILHLLS